MYNKRNKKMTLMLTGSFMVLFVVVILLVQIVTGNMDSSDSADKPASKEIADTQVPKGSGQEESDLKYKETEGNPVWVDKDKDDPEVLMWPIVPKYKPLVHDYYLSNKGNSTIMGLTHNNDKIRQRHYVYLYSRGHYGFDITAEPHTKIYAAADGSVTDIVYIKDNKSLEDYGNRLSISHRGLKIGNNVQTLYAHLSEITVYNGQEVKKGDLIGYSGNTGGSRIPHLHFEVKLNGSNVDPLECLPEFDLTSLKKKPTEEDGFSYSSVKLWNSIDKNKWDFKVYVKANQDISSGAGLIPEGTELELKKFYGGSAVVIFEGKTVNVSSSAVLYTY